MYRGILFKNGVKVERVVTGRMVLVHLNRTICGGWRWREWLRAFSASLSVSCFTQTGSPSVAVLRRFNLPIIPCTSILLQMGSKLQPHWNGSFAVRRFEADGWSLVEIPGSGCLGNQLMHLLPGRVLIIGFLHSHWECVHRADSCSQCLSPHMLLCFVDGHLAPGSPAPGSPAPGSSAPSCSERLCFVQSDRAAAVLQTEEASPAAFPNRHTCSVFFCLCCHELRPLTEARRVLDGPLGFL